MPKLISDTERGIDSGDMTDSLAKHATVPLMLGTVQP